MSDAATLQDQSEKFLGVRSGTDDAAALLGVRAESASEGEVITALQARLELIASHPEGLTPGADELRLALHDAAQRLLQGSGRTVPLVPVDPQSVAEAPAPFAIEEDGGRGAVNVSGSSAATVPAKNGAEVGPFSKFEAGVAMILANAGGWNRRAQERVGTLAQLHGVPLNEALQMAQALAMGGSARPVAATKPAVTTAPARAVSTSLRPMPPPFTPAAAPARVVAVPPTPATEFDPFPHERDPGAAAVKRLVIGSGAVFLGLAALMVLFVLVRPSRTRPAPPSPAPVTASNTPPTSPPPAELFPSRTASQASAPVPPPPMAKNRVGDWDDLLREASAATTLLDTDAAAAQERFAACYTLMSQRWVEASGDGIVAGVDRLVDYLYRAAQKPGGAEKAVEVIVEGAAPLAGSAPLSGTQVTGAVWSVGVLARLAREKDLPAAIRQSVQDGLAVAVTGAVAPSETTFKAGASAAIALVPARLLWGSAGNDADAKRVGEAWTAWLAALAGTQEKQSPMYTRGVLLALEGLMTRGPEPTRDRGVFESIGKLTTALPWRKEDESRRWLLRWFSSPDVSGNDLYAVTASLAHASGAEGVDSSMVLSASAAESDRSTMRDRYATIWGLAEGESKDTLQQRWAEAAAAELAAAAGTSAMGTLEEAVTAARLNRAAMLLMVGDTADVGRLLEPVKPGTATQAPGDRSKREALGGQGSSDWLVKYRAAGRNIPGRRELLANVGGGIGPGVADVLVEEACRGSPAQVQGDARQVVLKHLNEPAFINALLEFAPMMPMTRANKELVEQATQVTLPSLRDPSWRVSVRRALVERLTQALAGQSELARVDELCDQLAELYGPRDVKTAAGTIDAPAVLTGPSPIEVVIVQARLRWQREAEMLTPSSREPYSLAQIEQRRGARVRLASGRVQQFAAEQAAIAELMAFVSVAEQPGRSAEAGEALTQMETQRRSARHIFGQLLATERAQLNLWMLRLKGNKA